MFELVDKPFRNIAGSINESPDIVDQTLKVIIPFLIRKGIVDRKITAFERNGIQIDRRAAQESSNSVLSLLI